MAFDRAALERPIREREPSGDWLRRDGIYVEVQAAMKSEAADPDYGIEEKRPDWAAAQRICLDALSSRTKDLYLSICLLEAATNNDGVAGLSDSLWMIRTVHDRFWDDFYPRPREGNNLDGRLNQLDALVGGFQRIVDSVALGESADGLTFFDWRHTDAKLPNGEPSSWSHERRRQVIHSTSWGFFDQGRQAAHDAREHLRALDETIDARYGDQAPSLSEMGGVLEDLEAAFAHALVERGPAPHVREAQEILTQTGCTFLELDWLADHVRAGLPTSRALNSIRAAVVDEQNGAQPEEGWAPTLETTWRAGGTYERTTKDVVPQQQPPTGETTRPAEDSPPPPMAPVVASIPAPRAHTPASGSVRSIVEACRALRATEPGNPLAFTVLRTVRWQEVSEPESGARLPAPATGARNQIVGLFEGGRWAEVLELSEALLESDSGPYWLDLQRYACAAMGELGAPYGPCRRELLRSLSDHLQHHAWLVKASLGDDAPAADDTTRNWIREEVLSSAGTSSQAPLGSAPLLVAESGLAEALELLENEGFESAVERLRSLVDGARSGRSRATASLDLAELCFAADRAELAAPILEGVRRDLLTGDIARWEGPELRSQCLSSLYRAYSRLASTGVGGEYEGRLRDLAEDIARLDLSLRLQLEASQT